MHISCLADKFVDDPHKVVKAGQIVKVKVLEVDVQRKRIALTMRLQETSAERRDRGQGAGKPKPRNTKPARANKQRAMPANNAMAEKLAAAFKK